MESSSMTPLKYMAPTHSAGHEPKVGCPGVERAGFEDTGGGGDAGVVSRIEQAARSSGSPVR